MAGIELTLGESLSLFAEAQYRFLEVDGAEMDDDDVEFDDEVEFTGLGINAGLLIRF